MKKHLSFFFTFVILIGLLAGCSNNEEKIASLVFEHKELALLKKDSINFDVDAANRGQLENDDEDKPDSISKAETGKSGESNASIASVQEKDEASKPSNQAENNQTEDKPYYQVNLRKGFMAQQRLVEVDLEVDNPEEYQVLALNEELKYRKDVNLFVGLVNSMDDDKIVQSIQVTQK